VIEITGEPDDIITDLRPLAMSLCFLFAPDHRRPGWGHFTVTGYTALSHFVILVAT
jgi:hypothetical protein